MASKSRNIVVGSMGIAGLMALAAVLDMALGIPFQGQIAFDIMFLLGAALTLYMGFDCLKHAK